jgi:HD-GYP domain-containing protein (c-di-GMP phosphodiesterase class II)
MSTPDKENTSKELINSLSVVIKTSQIHHVDNISVVNAINKFHSIFRSLLSKDSVTIELVGEFFHVDGSRVRYSMEYIFNYDFLVREFKKRELGSVVLHASLKEDDIKRFISALLSVGFSENPFDSLLDSLKGSNTIVITRLRKIKDEGSDIDRRKIIKKNYFNTVLVTRDISQKISLGEKISLKKAKRVMETMVNNIIEDESMLVGMTSIKDYDDYTYHHSVNVSILSIALGHRLGLSKKTLAELGLSALMHDLGKVEVPKEILNKPIEFSDEDWNIIMKHPAWGACAVFKIKGVDITSMSAFISAFEHHLNYDLSGYPKLRSKIELNFFSRIIAIADQYDAMTSSRVYSRIPLPPDKALSIMIDRSGTQLDPYLTKVFINMVGVYPLGSIVMLNTRELGIVFDSNTNPDFLDRPRVIILVDREGNKSKTTVDLMEKDEQGNFIRNIVKTLDSNQYNINLAEYLL